MKIKHLRLAVSFFWDCTEKEFNDYFYKNYNIKFELTGAEGTFNRYRDKNIIASYIWIKKKNNYVTLAHEIIHMVIFWLQNVRKINLDEDTQEVNTMLHSFYMGEFLKALK